jgi:hypothetical protein
MKVGDHVVWFSYQNYSHTKYWGKISKISPSGVVTVTVKVNGAVTEQVFKKNRNKEYVHGFRLATEGELAQRAWVRAAPKPEITQITRGWGSELELAFDAHASTSDPDCVAKLRAICAELETIASWLASKPDGRD